MNNNQGIQNNEEISLIDLFVVLVRYRKMILSIILCSIIVVIAGYFVYPSRQKSYTITEKTYTTSIAISLTPGARYLLYYQSLIPYFMYPLVIQDAIEDTQEISLQPKEMSQWIPAQGPLSGEERTYTSANNNLYLGEERTYTSANNKLYLKENIRTGVLEISYNGADPLTGIVFLQSLFLHGSKALEGNIMPLAEAFINTYESSSLPAADNDYVMVKAICDGKIPVLVQVFDPYVLERETVIVINTGTGRKYSMIALVVVFAAVFFSVFLAFCINALKNMKNDQETMHKLREAMGKTDTDNEGR